MAWNNRLGDKLTWHKATPVDDGTSLHALWIKDLDPSYETGNLPIALNSPLIYRGKVFIGHNSGKMQSYDLENGRLLWSENERGTYHSAPVGYNDLILYGTVQGRFNARNYLTGELVYSVDLGASVESEATISNSRVFVHLRNHKIFSLDAETGKVLWSYQRSVPFLNTIQGVSKPVVYQGKVLVGMADGQVLALGFDDGALLWERQLSSGGKFVDVDAAPFVYGDNVLVAPEMGPLFLLASSTGKVIRTVEYPISRSPILLNDGLVLGTSSGEVLFVTKDLKEVWRRKVSDGNITGYHLFKNRLVVTDVTGKVSILDPVLGKILFQKHLGHASSAIFGKMSVEGKHLLILSSRNRLYDFN